MLILARRVGETIVIGDGANKVLVTVIGVKGCQVKIGCDASQSIPIHREEIYEKIQRSIDRIGVNNNINIDDSFAER